MVEAALAPLHVKGGSPCEYPHIHPLHYQNGVHVTNMSHDGSLRTLAVSCGLIDILAFQHSSRPFPPTYIRGKKRIDYMLISASLQDAVVRSRILPYNAIFSGDHRPCFLDFDADILFSGKTPPLAPPCQRKLQLFDPRKTEAYKTALHKQLEYHKVFDKCKLLKEAAEQNLWGSDQIVKYDRLDVIITQSMLYAEKACSKRYTKRYEWSPQLIRAVESVRYWRLLLKRSKGLQIQCSTISRAKSNAHLPNSPEPVDQPSIINSLKKALTHMKGLCEHTCSGALVGTPQGT
jgi:hypothetical protein